MSDRIRVVVADDHPVFREGLRMVLERADDVDLVAEATDGREAVRVVAEHRPDVVLMDLHMPGGDGLAATRELRDRTRVLVLTMYDDDANVLAAMRAGACGYLVKGAGPDEVLSAVRAVASGHAVLGSVLAERMLDVFARAPVVPSLAERFPELSPREREILEQLADGLTNGQIAERLYISPITVRNHVSNVLAKLRVTDRRQAMLRARDQG